MTKPTPDDADRIFSGQGTGPLSDFVREAREVFATAPDAGTQARHLRAMSGEFAARPPLPAPRRRRLPVGRAAAAALAGTVLVAGSALAATGHLPAPAQNAVSDAAKAVGLTIPAPHDNARAEAGKARAAENKARAKQFVTAKKAWNECEKQAREHPSGPSGPTQPSGPTGPGACGAKPNPHDFRPEATPHGQQHGQEKDNGNHGRPANDGNHGQGNGQEPAPSAPTSVPGGNDGDHGNGLGNGHGNGGDDGGGGGPGQGRGE